LKRYASIAAIIYGILLNAALLAQSDRVVAPINSTSLSELPADIPSGAQPNRDTGPIDPSTVIRPVSLLFKPSDLQRNALSQLLLDQRNPSSPAYRRWLTPFEFADQFGLSPHDLAAITRWLQAQGLSITYTANGRNWIACSGTAANLQKAFHTPIHYFQANGRTHFANTATISIPAALADVVSAVRGLDNFHPVPFRHDPRSVRPELTISGVHYLAPGDLAAIYDINALYVNGVDGAGQKIVVAGQTDVELSDIASFRSTFGLPENPPQPVLYGPDPGFSPDDLIEADLDLEWAGATAPNASIIYVYSTDVFDSVFYAIDQSPTLAPVISLSYGGCEQDNRSYLDALRTAAQQANTEGTTWVASSGDTGAAGCDAQTDSRATLGLAVNVPASIPEVTAVGGAEFNENGGTYWNSSNGSNLASARGYIPEIAWNDTVKLGILNASGGGVSTYYPTPLWQTGAGFPNDGFRDVPDVALGASAYHDPYVFCTNGECANGELGLVGGTSVGAAIFAGVLGLLNQYLTSAGYISQPGLGNVNPALYHLAATTPLAFHDITAGTNVVPCATGTLDCSAGSFGYSAGLGYDHVTGLGTIDAYNLVTSWEPPVISGQPPTVGTTPASSVSSASATLAASVNPNGLESQFWFEYSTSSSMANQTIVDGSNLGAGTSATPVSVNLTGLAASTTYFYQAWASNSDGAGHGAILNFTTASLASGNLLQVNASPVAGGVLQPPTGQTYQIGTTVPVTAAENTGWTFSGWTGSVANPASSATTVVMNTPQSVTANFIPGPFTDVPPGNPFFDAVNLFYAHGITDGCSPTLYCPDETVTRAQMAVFIVRAVYNGDNFTLNQQTPYFGDVPEGSFGYNWIQKLYELGITTGCSAGYYCPNDSVTRGEMAAFIIRMRYAGAAFTFSSTPVFTDVPSGTEFFTYIQRMAEDNITSGCGGGMYCPDDSVTRGEMAVFIMRGAFNWLLPANSPAIVSVTPNQLSCCPPVTVNVTGANTNFVQGTTTIVTPQGITWSNLSVSSPTVFSVELQGTTTQPEPVYVQTGSEQEVLPNSLLPPN
jgi:subtilase family serine protease